MYLSYVSSPSVLFMTCYLLKIIYSNTLCCSFLGAFAKLLKAIISFVMYVCLSVCLSAFLFARNASTLTGLILIKYDIKFFPWFVETTQILFKSDNNEYFT